MQAILDDYVVIYNQKLPYQRRNMNGRTPAQAFLDGLSEKQLKKREQKGKKTTQK